MHIDLSHVPPDRSQLFLDYLRVEIPFDRSFTITQDGTNNRVDEDFYCEVEFSDGSLGPVKFSVRW